MTWQLDAWLRGWPPCRHLHVKPLFNLSDQAYRVRCLDCARIAQIDKAQIHALNYRKHLPELVWS